MNKIKVIELFAGIGATTTALQNLGYQVEHTGVVEFNKKVIECFNLIHKTNFGTIDITDYDPKDKEVDLVVGGFPCQPFSVAGKGLGFEDPRGKMFKEAMRVIKQTMPRNVILENVKGILNIKHRWIIEEIIKELRELGYKTLVKVINAKQFIPQNRERVFIMASRGEFKEVEIIPRTTILKNYLDKEVEESFYYGPEKIEKIIAWKAYEKPLDSMVNENSAQVKTITTRTQPGTASMQLVEEKGIPLVNNTKQGYQIGEDGDGVVLNFLPNEEGYGGSRGRVQKQQVPTIQTSPVAGVIEEKNNYYYIPDKGDQNGAYNRVFKENKDIGAIITTRPKEIIERTRINGLFSEKFDSENYITPENAKDGVGTITAQGAMSKQKILEDLKNGEIRIRSLTPNESLRLMGQPEENIKVLEHLPKSSRYFVAGNSMVVNVMEYVLKHFGYGI